MKQSPSKIPQIKSRSAANSEPSFQEHDGYEVPSVDSNCKSKSESDTPASNNPVAPGEPGYRIKQAFQENLAASNIHSPKMSPCQMNASSEFSPNFGMSPAEKQVVYVGAKFF